MWGQPPRLSSRAKRSAVDLPTSAWEGSSLLHWIRYKFPVSASNITVYPQLVHFGRFFLPTYGFLVALGVLIGLWISVRNSERLGIDGEKAWNLGFW